jgi:hypothetical protein
VEEKSWYLFYFGETNVAIQPNFGEVHDVVANLAGINCNITEKIGVQRRRRRRNGTRRRRRRSNVKEGDLRRTSQRKLKAS